MNKSLTHILINKDFIKWNQYRIENNFSSFQIANFNFLDCKSNKLFNFNFNNIHFKNCRFEKFSFYKCSFNNSKFSTFISNSKFDDCNFQKTKFINCKLKNINFQHSSFIRSVFEKSTLSNLNLFGVSFINCTFNGGSISDSSVFGTNIWLSNFNKNIQNNLYVDSYNESINKSNPLSVDDIEVSNFIYLITNNEKLRNIINATTSKMILILGRFRKEEKEILDQIKQFLVKKGLLPVIFDFENSKNKDLTGTVETLARMASMVIADITNPSSIPHELATIVPHLRSTAVSIIRLEKTGGYGMYKDLESYNWVFFTEYNRKNLSDKVDEILRKGKKINSVLRNI